MKLLTYLGVDAVGVAANSPDNFPTSVKDDIIENEWGMKFKDVGLYNEFCDFPLKQASTKKDRWTKLIFMMKMAKGFPPGL